MNSKDDILKKIRGISQRLSTIIQEYSDLPKEVVSLIKSIEELLKNGENIPASEKVNSVLTLALPLSKSIPNDKNKSACLLKAFKEAVCISYLPEKRWEKLISPSINDTRENASKRLHSEFDVNLIKISVNSEWIDMESLTYIQLVDYIRVLGNQVSEIKKLGVYSKDIYLDKQLHFFTPK